MAGRRTADIGGAEVTPGSIVAPSSNMAGRDIASANVRADWTSSNMSAAARATSSVREQRGRENSPDGHRDEDHQ